MADIEKQSSASIKAEITEAQVPNDTAAPNAEFQLSDPLKRQLKQRHVQMIAIAGTIGTGLFLGSGEALHVAGPLGALIAYMLVGTVAYSSLCSVGEMTTFAPISGTFPHFAARWVDPAFGFAVGWNYFYGLAISVPVEVAAAVILLSFWDDNTSHTAIYTAVICVLMCAINIFGVRYFGESEFFFALIKLSTITGLLLAGLVIDLGGGPNHDRIGFRYWKDPGALARAGLVSNINTDRFLAIMSVIIQAAFSFTSMELVAIAASETENPRRNIGKAVNRVVYRIVVFYVLGILMIGMLVSYDDDALLNTSGNAAQSPFVIAFNRAGVKVLPHIINAAVFTSAFSAGNSYLFCGSRILYGLALRGQGPRFLTYCTKNGLPLTAILVTCCFSLLSFMTVSSGAEQVFYWLQNLTATGGFIGWFCINLTYVFFRRGMLAQGFDLKANIYNHSWQPYLAWWGIFWTVFFTLVNGYAVFFSFNISDFLVAYINLPIFASLYFGYKFIMRTSVWKPEDMDLVTGIPSIEETEKPEVPPRTLLEKIAAILF
ncbi:general APC amino acid permease [Armillaria solidipes]|uniref:General APC amino acid permease n=1 Tax=Armillaria solidipes TaxID=1076256 RepID=A0A2H3BE12_9AGAR|nr:general APC amino acid permease [Armillaria solidipes]